MCCNYSICVRVLVALLLCASVSIKAQLSTTFYLRTCPNLQHIVFDVVAKASFSDPRIGASLIRLHFHDCFVQGCDASILLNKTATIDSEQDAFANANSIRGLDAMNNIKSTVERFCPGTVSCADMLAMAAEVSSEIGGGPQWKVLLGRRDSLTANRILANQNIPAPSFTLDQLKASFQKQGLDPTTDLVALSGAHTIGRAHCRVFVNRLYNFNNTGNPDPTLDSDYLQTLQEICPQNGNGDSLTNLDVSTPNTLDNRYYSNLRSQRGLLQSDQELYSTPGADTISLVDTYSNSKIAFNQQFAQSMIKMGNIGVLTGDQGEIRSHCNFVNGS
ncbi:hypothetical protein HN51_004076 [Arachis hypogaea]|uniref:Peroxidase n=1 Tax=Arachis hypogaea TaxID=3818 RepID=A0A445DJ20_ARAHY|nr:peroxidase A2 [Arachis hypogaea]QHO37643.1 Peroxidase [Arachis hypogaea]RYR63082.1 hypothetical protein Ahy_A04g020872 [Arachis hypogaea]